MLVIDRRVQRTRKLLSDALVALILEKGYDAITVQDITDRANLGRATLYLHYRDKEDLLLQTLQEGMDDLIAVVEKQRLHEPTADHASAFVLAFHHAAANADLYRVLFGGQGAAPTMHRVRDYIAGMIREVIAEAKLEQHSEFPSEVASQFMSGALLMLMEWWLRNEMPYTPEHMAEMITTLTIPGMRAAFGENPLAARDR